MRGADRADMEHLREATIAGIDTVQLGAFGSLDMVFRCGSAIYLIDRHEVVASSYPGADHWASLHLPYNELSQGSCIK